MISRGHVLDKRRIREAETGLTIEEQENGQGCLI